jgi:hypothetical protein
VRTVCALLLGSAVVVPASAGADSAVEELARQSVAVKASAAGGVIAWNERDRRTRRFHLVARRGAEPARRIDVAPRKSPFDLDLGVDERGDVVAVYSRCRRETHELDEDTGLPPFERFAGCRLHRYDFRTSRERRIAGVSGRGTSEFLPSLSGRYLAFARRPASRQAPVQLVRLRRTRRGATAQRRLPAGPSRDSGRPLTLDLNGDDLTYSWLHEIDACPDEGNIDESRVQPAITQMRVATDASSSRVLAQACNGLDPDMILGGGWSGADVVFGERTSDRAMYRSSLGLDLVRVSTDGRPLARRPVLRNSERGGLYVSPDGDLTVISAFSTTLNDPLRGVLLRTATP